MKRYNLILILIAAAALTLTACRLKPVEETTTTVTVVIQKPVSYTADDSARFDESANEWKEFYKDKFDMDVDFSEVPIPGNRPSGYSQMALLFIPQGLTPKKVYDSWGFLKEKGPDDFGNIWSVRGSDTSYAVWVSWQAMPDAYLMGMSVDSADSAGVHGMTLLERMVFETKYYDESRFHADYASVTLCSGSRLFRKDASKNLVPVVYSSSDKVVVTMRKVTERDTNMGIRNVYQ